MRKGSIHYYTAGLPPQTYVIAIGDEYELNVRCQDVGAQRRILFTKIIEGTPYTFEMYLYPQEVEKLMEIIKNGTGKS